MTATTEARTTYYDVPIEIIGEFSKDLNFVEKARFGLGADKRTYSLMERDNLKEAVEVARFFDYLSQISLNAVNSITSQEASDFKALIADGRMGPLGTEIFNLKERAIDQIAARAESSPVSFISTSSLVNEILGRGKERSIENRHRSNSQFFVEQQRLLRESGIYSHMI
ncbi:MAG: hypothetical protein ACI9S8_000599 [Chlamydiales bacterium]|jgi:hypothetical protein